MTCPITVSKMAIRSSKQLVFLIVVLALMARIGYSAYVGLGRPPDGDGRDYDALAQNMATGNGYALVDGRPNITRAPGFPIFLAGVYRAFGHSLYAARTGVCVIGALVVLFLFLVGKETFSTSSSLLAAAIASVYPPLVYSSEKMLSETLFALLLLIATYFLVLTATRSRKHLLSALSGLIYGLSALTRPITLILPVFLLPWFVLCFPTRRGVVFFLLFLTAFCAVQVPWTIRNYMACNALIVGTVKGGMDLWWSNNPKVLSDEGKIGRYHRYFPPEYEGRSKVELNREGYRLAFSFLKENLSQIPKLVMHKQLNFWNPVAGESLFFNVMSLLSYGVIAPFYIFTVLRLVSGPDYRVVFPLITIFFIAVTSLYYGTVRFRMPLEPYILLLGADGMLRFKEQISGRVLK